LAELVAQSQQLYCGFDLDDTGEAMASSMMALHPSIQRLRPSRKDWNDVLQSKPAAA
jgi:5S rRNA maturation endonuclease (ribonuclease M5)